MRIEAADPSAPLVLSLLDQLSDTLTFITGDSGRASFNPADVAVHGALFAVAYDSDGTPVGCGAYRPLCEEIAEVKRMFAAPGSKGVGAAILAFLEQNAAADGYRELWLETRLVNDRAVRFYEKHGYSRIPNFGKYVGRPEAVCLGKALAGPV